VQFLIPFKKVLFSKFFAAQLGLDGFNSRGIPGGAPPATRFVPAPRGGLRAAPAAVSGRWTCRALTRQVRSPVGKVRSHAPIGGALFCGRSRPWGAAIRWPPPTACSARKRGPPRTPRTASTQCDRARRRATPVLQVCLWGLTPGKPNDRSPEALSMGECIFL